VLGENVMATTVLETFPTYRFKDTLELLSETGFWATIKRLVILRDMLKKSLSETWPKIDNIEKKLPLLKDTSTLREAKSGLEEAIYFIHGNIEHSEKTIVLKLFLRFYIQELKQICERLEDLLENVELALEPTFRRSVKQALSELPPDVGSKAKEELNDWLHHS
jgi:hypothetical protein